MEWHQYFSSFMTSVVFHKCSRGLYCNSGLHVNMQRGRVVEVVNLWLFCFMQNAFACLFPAFGVAQPRLKFTYVIELQQSSLQTS